ncbi:lysozyme inhibitor LprI family protein [Pseudomonas fulva]|uniref:lysozyme inhibitor LprI family protein n=1 Tax=Pseudomonas TaxID=286 RepID=UPI00062A0079|nr:MULTISPECIES: lysozyme inhibitor LprI family protein [Pseudomonas]MCK2116093.1 lysozyme inhibitor LprI family protein [Pseudomonas juntendi]MDH1308131.1 lysozyme inhibitor LprI family protein [Pseudomonas fulva]
MRPTIYSIVAIVFGLSNSALAKDNYSPAYSNCMDKAGGVTYDMVECSSAELSLQDARLNLAYKNAMGVLSSESKNRLREAQRIWIKFRDADCSIYYNLSGGTMDSLNGAGCELSMTQERADALEWIARNGGE